MKLDSILWFGHTLPTQLIAIFIYNTRSFKFKYEQSFKPRFLNAVVSGSEYQENPMFGFLRKNKKQDQKPEDENIVNSENQAESLSEQSQNKPIESSSEEAISKATTESDDTAKTVVEELAPESLTQATSKPPIEAQPDTVEVIEEVETKALKEVTEEPKPEKKGFFTRLKHGLTKTRQSFTDSISNLVLGKKEIDDDLLDDLEMILLTADVGIEATDRIISNLTQQVSRKELKDPEALVNALQTQLQDIIEPMAKPLNVDEHLAKNQGPFVILMVGINGVGKTTTIGKLAKKYQLEGKSVMLAAGDTFRAAAVEQLETWGERNQVPVIAQKTGADSAAVIFDAIQSAKAKNIDVLIADTAGRLHTQSNLMEELKKVKRVMAKVDETAPHEVMLVIDAGTGQNALNQAQQFGQAVDVSGITLTKLDGTAKGGIVYALAEQLQIPIRFIGVGEQIDDLREFNSKDFTQALFDQSKAS